jgi:hypothetical protein
MIDSTYIYYRNDMDYIEHYKPFVDGHLVFYMRSIYRRDFGFYIIKRFIK